MNDVRVEFDNVWKLFRKGHRARSLRDAVPAVAAKWKTLWGGAKRQERRLGVDEFYSLQGVSFQVRSGECLGIIGPNGAGKSTMLKCASRILRPNQGSVRVKGRVSALIEVGAGFHPDLTGRENVFLNGTILGMKRKEISDRFDDIVEFAGMADFIDMPVSYSSGMYARLGFAVAAFMEPDVLLIDEVLSVGDMAFARRCEKKIKEIVSGDTTVLFISHNLAAVRTICDRVLVLSRGQVIFDGDPDKAIAVYHSLVSGGEDVPSHGHPDIQRLRFTLQDAYGSPITNAEPGDVLTLDAELVAQNQIDEASIGFFVRDVNDSDIYSCSMESLGVEPVDLAPGETLRVRFRLSANLVPGVYGIGSVLHGRPSLDRTTSAGRICFEHTPNRQQLAVTGGSEVRGCANLFAGCVASVEPSMASSALSME